MNKKLTSLIAITLCVVTLFGCSEKDKDKQPVSSKSEISSEKKEDKKEKVVDKKEDKQEEKKEDKSGENKVESGIKQEKKLDVEKIVTANFGKEDKLLDFKLKTTKNFLSNYEKIAAELDSRYGISGTEPTSFDRVKEQSQLRYTLEIKDYDNRYQYIKKVQYGLYFNDDKSQVTFQELDLVLCDDNKDGKIELNDKTKKILQTVYPKIDLAETQKRINESIACVQKKDYKMIRLESVDKYHNVSFRWFKYKEDTPIEITIEMQTYEDYPVK